MTSWVYRWRFVILTILGLLPGLAVAGVTGTASWGHIVHVGHIVGEPSAAWLPVAIDGMMVAGAVFAFIDRLKGYSPRPWATASFLAGSAMTLTGNVVSALERGPWAMVVAAIYAIALLFTVETIFHPSKRLLKVKAARTAEASSIVATDSVSATTEPTVTAPAPVSQATAPARPHKQARRRKAPPRATEGQGVRTRKTDSPVSMETSRVAIDPAPATVPVFDDGTVIDAELVPVD